MIGRDAIVPMQFSLHILRGMLLLEHGAGNMHLPGSEAALSSC